MRRDAAMNLIQSELFAENTSLQLKAMLEKRVIAEAKERVTRKRKEEDRLDESLRKANRHSLVRVDGHF